MARPAVAGCGAAGVQALRGWGGAVGRSPQDGEQEPGHPGLTPPSRAPHRPLLKVTQAA